MTPPATSQPFTSIDQIKVGMRVRVRVLAAHGGANRSAVGTICKVLEAGTCNCRLEGMEPCPYFLHADLAPADESPLAIARYAAEAAAKEVARLEAEEVKAKVLESLPEPLRKCHEYLKANPSAFGCQQPHVRAIVEILTGGKLP